MTTTTRPADAGKWIGGRIALLLDAAFGSRAGRSLGVLLYHRVAESPRAGEGPTLNVTPRHFRRQIEGLLRYGYTFWPLREAVERARDGRSLPEKAAVITFDDGYQSVYLNAWPVLSELRVPATVFVTTAFVDDRDPFPFDRWGLDHKDRASPEAWRPLTWSQCAEMERSGLIEIGSHSHSHESFRGRPEALERDLRTSMAELARRLGPRNRPFAFPFGSGRGRFADAALLEAVARAGATCAMTTEIELVDHRTKPFAWGRLEIGDGDTPAVVKAKLEGWYTWMARARDVFRSTRRALSVRNGAEARRETLSP